MTGLAVAGIVVVLLALAALGYPLGANKAMVITAAVGAVAGLFVKPEWRRVLVLSLIPATLMTNSDVVPHDGRYVPSLVVLAALIVSSRKDIPNLLPQARALPTWLLRLLVAYVVWMAATAIFSTQRGTSATYVVGSIVTIGVAFLVIPALPRRTRLIEELIATLVVTSVVIVLSGLLFALAGSVHVLGNYIGLYFVTEATLFGHPTGLIFLQDYGPFIGPETTPLSLGLVGSLYFATRTIGRARIAWVAAGAVILLGLLSTFSREGWLIVVITCLAVAIPSRTASRIAKPALATGLVMLVFFAAGITNVLGVNGRIDLTNSWYGPAAASVLLNPNPATHGQAQTPAPRTSLTTGIGTLPVPTTGTSPTPGVRTLLAPCVAVQASGTASGPTVQLKGYSSLLARLCLWEAAARAIVHRPVFGFGPGTGTDAIVPFFYGQGAGLVGASTHDTYLRVGVEMGVPGLAIYLALSAIAAWLAIACLRAGKGPEVVLAASILAITVAELTDTLLFGGLSFPGFWLAMALGLLAANRTQEQPVRAAQQRAVQKPLQTPHAVAP